MRWWREVAYALNNRRFWAIFGWSLLAVCVLVYLFSVAIKVASGFSLANPVLCDSAQSQWRLLVLLLLGPIFAASLLSTIGELQNALTRQARGGRFRGFVVHAGVTALLGTAMLLAMRC